MLTFLAGAELDPAVFRTKWKEASAVGVVGFVAPFLGCAAAAHWLLDWDVRPSWLAGVALSTTSVAVVYAVMLEFGLNRTDYGKTILAACFINDLLTVLALGLIFAPFTVKTLVFAGGSLVAFVILPWLTPRFFRWYGGRPSELEAKFLLLTLFGLGALATWADSEAVLPAYMIGMVLAGTVGKDHVLVRRLRTLTFGLLTPVLLHPGRLLRVGSRAGRRPVAFVVLLGAKMAAKFVGVFPMTRVFNSPAPGVDVHDPADVDRPHLRDDLVAVRPLPSHHHPGAIFPARGRRDRQRRRADADRQRLLSAPPPAAGRRTRRDHLPCARSDRCRVRSAR